MRHADDSVYDNLSLDKKVGFIEDGHRYVHLERPDIKFTSVTTLIKQYKDEFDSVGVSKKVCADPKSKYYGMDPEEVAAGWKAYGDECSAKGTELHSYGEYHFNLSAYCEALLSKKPYDGVVPDDIKVKHAEAAVKYILDKGYQLAATELLVYSTDVKVAGQSDILLKKKIYGSTEYDYMIYDWKFLSKPIEKKSFYNKKTGYKMMKGPFKYLMDCNWIHYSIQMALYQTLTGDPVRVSEKVMIIVREDGYELVPAYPMRVFWDQNDQLQCVHEIWNGRWWDSRMESLYKKKPKDIVGI